MEKDFLIYQEPDGDIKVRSTIKDDTIWLAQKAMSELFHVGVPAISKHLDNIYDEGELSKSATISKMEIVQDEGGRKITRQIDFYNLDAIISVGYRVNSARATKFRVWATKVLKEYIQKGFVLDDERLKQGEAVFGKDYFRELLERVRSIRASERRIWQQITDVFAEISVDYDRDSQITKDFYATVQNKFHYAITGQTAAEIVYDKANHQKSHMGLTTWKHSPNGRILKSDVAIAKNYLTEAQIRRLERSVSGYFDYVEDLIESENVFKMADFARSIDDFISFRKWQVLGDKGKIPADQARQKAEIEYREFNKTQKIISDFDRKVKQLASGNKRAKK
jgi:hypothetical protein